jgi:hypothetical protein
MNHNAEERGLPKVSSGGSLADKIGSHLPRPDQYDGCYNCDFQQRGYCPQQKVTIQHDKMVCGGAKWMLKQPKGETHGRQAHST